MRKRITRPGILILLLTAIMLICAPPSPKGQLNPELQSFIFRYGQPVPWSEVRLLFPRYTVAVVEDLETGKRFAVTRRGGTYHADVQPLTVQDTQTLREIFREGWTWKRRAIVVEVGQQRLAASMNGMPHGSGKIQGNDFPGHFCLHFLGSKVHKSRKVDRAHQMMIWKAAGQPMTPYQKAEPREVVELIITAINQGDGELAILGIESLESEDLWLVEKCLLQQLPEIELRQIKVKEEGADQVRYQVQTKLLYPGKTAKVAEEGEFIVKLNQVSQRWLLEGKGLKELLTSPN